MEVNDLLLSDRIVAVVRAPTVADPTGLATALADAGVRLVELTFTIDGVLDAIAAAAGTDAVVGAGTVLTARDAHRAIDAGARFVVCPIVETAVADAAAERDVPAFLAGFTPTELRAAHTAGALAVKLFPARLGGPRYVQDVLGPLDDVPLMPSGGVDEHNAAAYLDAGAVAVNAGSSIAPEDAVVAGDHDTISARAAALVAALP